MDASSAAADSSSAASTIAIARSYSSIASASRPRFSDAVAAMNFIELKKANLETGPLLHIVAWITPGKGYAPFRAFVKAMNPWGVTGHRYKAGGFRLAAQKNRYFTGAGQQWKN